MSKEISNDKSTAMKLGEEAFEEDDEMSTVHVSN